MFTTARLKLTGWYLLIIMIISGLFSLVVYRGLTAEIGRGMRLQAFRNFSDYPFLAPPDLDTEIFNEAQHRVAIDLFIINAGILVMSGISSYFLAGKTLRPIEVMVEDQKRFIADASHELRTPLTAMKTEIEVALRDKKLDSKEAHQLLESNLEEVNKMQSLSNYLLSLNRYQNSDAKLNMQKINLSQLVEKTISSVSPLAEKKHVSIESKDSNVVLNANSVSLSELLTILLDNAVKYSHPNSKVIVSLTTDPKHAIISIQDFGIGIKAVDIPFIFNRFYRADSSRTKTQIDGYGLGLSIAKNIVELHHGTIAVDSAPDAGSTFIVKLPLSLSA